MEILNNHQLKQVSGGIEAVTVLGALSVANLLLGIYNYRQIQSLNYMMSSTVDITGDLLNWSIFHEAQLSQLPNYSTVSSMSVDQALNSISNA